MSRAVTYRSLSLDGLEIAYREAGDPSQPTVVLLHGFPSSSHQYRDLVPALADTFHVVAPDYPGFGLSSRPDPATFPYTFDRFAEVIERFLAARGIGRYGLFMQDYGGPGGFRPLERGPGAIARGIERATGGPLREDSARLAAAAWDPLANDREALLGALEASQGGRNLARVGLAGDVELCAQVDADRIVPELADGRLGPAVSP